MGMNVEIVEKKEALSGIIGAAPTLPRQGTVVVHPFTAIQSPHCVVQSSLRALS